NGTTAETLAKSTVCKAATAPAGQTSFLHQFLCDRIQRPSHFFEHHRKLQFQHRLLRIDYYIDAHHIYRALERKLQRRPPQPHRFPQPPLHPVPLYRAAQHAAPRDPTAQPLPRYSARPPPQKKHGHVRRKVPPSLLVHELEIGVLPQPPRTRKATRNASACIGRGLRCTPVRSVGVHQLTIPHNS